MGAGDLIVAYPPDVNREIIVRPALRPVVARARITSPPAVESDSYLGGFARGHRLTYSDEKHFVWWTGPADLVAWASFSNAFSSAFQGGVGSPTGSGFSVAFSSAFR